MSERKTPPVERDAIIEFHNELVRELNDEKAILALIKGKREQDELMEDPRANYTQGKVVGFEMATNALRAFLEAERLGEIDVAQLLGPATEE